MKIKEEKIEIVTDLDPAVPRIRADGERLSQALINMILNAIEASPVESQLGLKTRLLKDGGSPQALITVEDEEGAISEDDRKEIFKPFFTIKSKGTGLGLANIHRIVEAHGGRVEVSNLPARGDSL